MLVLNGITYETIEELEIAIADYSDDNKTYIRNQFNGVPNVPTSAQLAEYNLNVTIKTRREYAEGLIERMKYNNVTAGINAFQGFKMHQRLRAFTFNFYGVSYTIDLLNLVVSGDVELACLALQNAAPDDFTSTDHWLTQARIDFLVNDMKTFLGWP